MGAAGRPRGRQLPQGGFHGRMRPHCVAEKSAMLRFRLRRKPRPVEEKKAPGRAPVRQPSARQGPAYRCLLRFCLAFGHAIPFCDSCDYRPVADSAEGIGVQGRI